MAKKNKNKIRVLDSNQDLSDLFINKPDDDIVSSEDTPKKPLPPSSSHEDDKESEMSDKEFAELLEFSLKGKSMDKMMQEKKERGAPQKVPLSKRLKRYPPPESRLDLHGFTSDGATMKADSYIRTAFSKGNFTIKIIVGKGTHSDFGAVLPGVIQDLLLKLKNEGLILHFIWEKKKKSKSGAIIVYLNQFND
ncbi:MAG: Smr/MutS family protein [Desulfobacteraceae bacterium]|nr:Smr/MutS family protein [Desulfobacteraceae bacterium]